MSSIHSIHKHFSYEPLLRELSEDSSFVCYEQSNMLLPMPNLNKIPKQFMILIRQTHCTQLSIYIVHYVQTIQKTNCKRGIQSPEGQHRYIFQITCTTHLTHCTMLTAPKKMMKKLTLLSSSSRLVFSPGLIVEGVEEPLQLPLVCMSGGCFTGIGALSFWLHCSFSLLISSFPAY